MSESLERIEDSIEIYTFSVFWKDQRGRRNYRQRAMLITMKPEIEVRNRIEQLAQEIAEIEGTDMPTVEVVPSKKFIEKNRQYRPQDSAVCSIVSPLRIVKRSPKTGDIFYDESYKYCPKTSFALKRVIGAGNP